MNIHAYFNLTDKNSDDYVHIAMKKISAFLSIYIIAHFFLLMLFVTLKQAFCFQFGIY